MNYQILKAKITDAEEILELQKLAYQVEAKRYNNYDIPPLKQTLEELKNQFKNHIILKAVLDGKIIGTVRAYEKDGTCYVGRLAVYPDMHNQGVGTALMKEIEKYFCPKRYELFVGSKSDNNIYLYKKLDYNILRKDIDQCCDIEIFYMEKHNVNIDFNFSKTAAIACFTACIGDFLITFILGAFYPGYNHLKLTMSELGATKSPVAFWINAWWIIYGILIIIFGIGFGKALNIKNNLTKLCAFLIIIFGIGAGISSGIFSYGTLSKIHDILAGTAYLAILFLPILSIRLFLDKKISGLSVLSVIIQILGLLFFIIFIISENSNFKNNMLNYTGLWQRLFLSNCYIYLLIISYKIFLKDKLK